MAMEVVNVLGNLNNELVIETSEAELLSVV